jgi:hypothetical protein
VLFVRFLERELEREHGTEPWFALYGDDPFVEFHDLEHKRKSEARAWYIGDIWIDAIERFEDVPDILLGHTDTGV